MRYRPTNKFSSLAVVCLAGVLLSTTAQTAHFCAVRASAAHTTLELSPASSGPRMCLICLMAPSSNAVILLVAFFVRAGGAGSLSRQVIRYKPILGSFHLYTRPPPIAMA
jgi:hypothetical protein